MLSLSLWTSLSLVALSMVIISILRHLTVYRRLTASYAEIPGTRFFAYSFGVLSLKIRLRGITTPRNYNFLAKHTVYEQYGWDIISNIVAWPKPSANIWVADADAIKEITRSRTMFPKNVGVYTMLNLFGENIVASEGEDWRRHRKVSQPAFSEKNNRLVWDETVRIVEDMIESWGSKPEVTVDHIVQITLPIALLVIGSAGFGKRMSWDEDLVVPEGHKMSFRTSLSIVSKDLFLKLVIPKWASGLTQRYRDIFAGFDELQLYMQEMIQSRQGSQTKAERYDLFSSLMDASDEEGDSGLKLSRSELMGNIFIFLLAGHETTAHTLAFTFALLALYPEEQELLYQQIKSVTHDGKLPGYTEMSTLTRSMAVFYETLRLYPPVNIIPKTCAEDTILTCHAAAQPGHDASQDELPRRMIHIRKNTRVLLHPPGLHYNPRYWEEPHKFKPERFLGDWPRDAFIPFSSGARACLGRRFFETEGIAILSVLVSQYKIEVKDDPQFAGESFEMKKARLLRCKAGITLTPVEVPLVFKRRNS